MASQHFKKKNGHEVEGVWYPRVTSICRVIPKPGLERWLANQKNFAVTRKKRINLIHWGRLIHHVVESILLGRLPKINPSIQPSITAFLGWFREHEIEVQSIEKRVVSQEHLYSGTIDVIGKIDGQWGVLDFKTGSEVWDDYFIQTAAYLEAHNEEAAVKERISNHWVLRIDQYRKCKLCGAKKREKSGFPVVKGGNKGCSHKWGEPQGMCEFKEAENFSEYWEAFLAAKELWEFSNRHRLAKIKNYPSKNKKFERSKVKNPLLI